MTIGNYDMACQKIKLALDISPTNSLLSDYGWCLFLSGNLEKAQKILVQLLSISPDSLTHYRLGRIYFSQSDGRKDRSLAYNSFLKSVQLNTQFAPGFEYLGKYYLEVDLDLNRAIKCFEKAFSLDKKLFESIESMTEAYLRLERVQLAIQVLKQFLEIFPRHAWSWTKLGFLYLVT
jgi:superkiller protein 3